GGTVRGVVVPGANRWTGSQLNGLGDRATKEMGFAGLVWVRPGEPPKSNVKALEAAVLNEALARSRSTSDDLLLLAAGPPDATSMLFGQLRLEIAKKENLIRDGFEFAWIVEFPLVEWHAEDARWYSVNHPFTAPMDEDIGFLESDPGRVRAKAY